eukprot:6185588-Pleurochrysis_carterae.AAC.4
MTASSAQLAVKIQAARANAARWRGSVRRLHSRSPKGIVTHSPRPSNTSAHGQCAYCLHDQSACPAEKGRGRPAMAQHGMHVSQPSWL